jgi:hypothetical protein
VAPDVDSSNKTSNTLMQRSAETGENICQSVSMLKDLKLQTTYGNRMKSESHGKRWLTIVHHMAPERTNTTYFDMLRHQVSTSCCHMPPLQLRKAHCV